MTGVDCEALRVLLAHCDGKDCTCLAYSRRECCCSVDWTPAEIYTLRAELAAKSAAYDALVADAQILVAQFRHNAQGCTRHEAHAAGTWRSCARELERLLVSDDRPSPTAGEK